MTLRAISLDWMEPVVTYKHSITTTHEIELKAEYTSYKEKSDLIFINNSFLYREKLGSHILCCKKEHLIKV